MVVAYVSIGSNIGPRRNVRRALRLLAAREMLEAVSTVYRTVAIGDANAPRFLNCVVRLRTDRPPLELKRDVLRKIETELGRRRGRDKYAPRTIDLDLILYDDLVVKRAGLHLPDPDILDRPFLLLCLRELDPGLTLPGSGLSVAEAAARSSRDGIEAVKEFARSLRKEIAGGRNVG